MPRLYQDRTQVYYTDVSVLHVHYPEETTVVSVLHVHYPGDYGCIHGCIRLGLKIPVGFQVTHPVLLPDV